MKRNAPQKSRPARNGPGRPVDETVRSQRRQQIVEAAHIRFAEKGFHAATTAEISAEAGISVASLFQYFPTKNDLIHALVQYELDIDLGFLKRLGAFDDLYEGLSHLGHYLAGDPELQRSMRLRAEVFAEAGRNAAVAEMMVAWEARMVSELKDVVLRAQSRGQVAADLDPAKAALLLSSYCDSVMMRVILPLPHRDEMIDNAVAFLRQTFCDPRLPRP